AHEAEFRLFLRASLLRGMEEHADPLRGARRGALLAAALAPLRDELGAGDVVRVRAALSALVGTEAYFALRDVLRLPPDEARAGGGGGGRPGGRAARAEGGARDTRHTPAPAAPRGGSPAPRVQRGASGEVPLGGRLLRGGGAHDGSEPPSSERE